jgi:hypothetical protein
VSQPQPQDGAGRFLGKGAAAGVSRRALRSRRGAKNAPFASGVGITVFAKSIFFCGYIITVLTKTGFFDRFGGVFGGKFAKNRRFSARRAVFADFIVAVFAKRIKSGV